MPKRLFNYKQTGKITEDLSIVMQLGLTMAGCIVFCFFIGLYLDRVLGTKGIFITLFIILGVIGGGITAYRQTLEITADTKKEPPNKENGTD